MSLIDWTHLFCRKAMKGSLVKVAIPRHFDLIPDSMLRKIFFVLLETMLAGIKLNPLGALIGHIGIEVRIVPLN